MGRRGTRAGPNQNCGLALRHATVNGNVARGFYVKPDRFRVLLHTVWYPGTNSKAGVGVTSPLTAGVQRQLLIAA
ncbi:MAG TPA: hypothetical protein VH682_04330 [Gemmataceae bacterium]